MEKSAFQISISDISLPKSRPFSSSLIETLALIIHKLHFDFGFFEFKFHRKLKALERDH